MLKHLCRIQSKLVSRELSLLPLIQGQNPKIARSGGVPLLPAFLLPQQLNRF